MTSDLANNSNGYVTVIGLITNIDTSAYTDGQQLYLSGTTAGTLTGTKTYAPTHLVYVAVVEHAHATQGKLFVKVQNGYELDELHNVSAQSPSNGQTLIYNNSTSLWEKANLTAGTGISVSNGAGSITVTNSGVTSITGTAPISSSGGTTPAISLATAYGDTQNPYASKTANYVLAAPNGSAGVPTFRAIVAADIPTLNQNTTGSAATLTTARAIYGNNFDGSAALTQIIASTYGGTGNSFTKFTGATTAEKTYTLPNSNATLLYDGGALGTPSSGTVTNLTGTASININGTVGATTANTGAFTTLSVSSTVSGTGFSTYLASPPAIGGTTAADGSFATLKFNSGYGSVATAYGCRAWVNFNGTGTVAIRASGNVSSITDNGVGQYTINFTSAMPDTNYSASILGGGGNAYPCTSNVFSTTSLSMYSWTTASAFFDNAVISVAIFR
jgi:hypothetical protein